VDLGLSLLRWKRIVQRLAAVRNKRINVHQGADLIRDFVGRPGDHTASVRVAAQHYVGELLPTDKVHNVGDVRLKVNLPGQKMRTLTYA
jgi:hypothetical protein